MSDASRSIDCGLTAGFANGARWSPDCGLTARFANGARWSPDCKLAARFANGARWAGDANDIDNAGGAGNAKARGASEEGASWCDCCVAPSGKCVALHGLGASWCACCDAPSETCTATRGFRASGRARD